MQKKDSQSLYKEKKWKSKECVKTNWKICAIIFFVDLSLSLCASQRMVI